jgi:hypothetical protein
MDGKEFKDWSIGIGNLAAVILAVLLLFGLWQFLAWVTTQNEMSRDNSAKACEWCYDNNISCNEGCGDCVTLYRRVYDLKRADFPTYCVV